MDYQHDQSYDKRQFPRFPFSQAVKFQTGEYSCPDGSLSRDLSHGGMSLTLNDFIAVKSAIVVYLQLHQESKVVELKGAVSWIKIIPESERYHIGIQFNEQEKYVQMEVNDIIEALNH